MKRGPKKTKAQITTRIDERILDAARVFAEDRKIHLTDLIEDSLLLIMGKRREYLAWHEVKVETRTAARQLMAIMESQTPLEAYAQLTKDYVLEMIPILEQTCREEHAPAR